MSIEPGHTLSSSRRLVMTFRKSLLCTCSLANARRSFATSAPRLSHENPLVRSPLGTSSQADLNVFAQGLPRNDAPPTIPRMQRGLPTKRGIPGARRVVVVSSGKGGVGKSSVSVNLALALSQLPAKPRIGLLDLDIFGPSIPKLMGLEGVGEPFLSKDNRLLPLSAHAIPCMSMGFLLPASSSGTGRTDNADTPVVWRGMMVMKAVQQLLFDVDWREDGSKPDLDVLVVDTPPGTGDVSLSLGQLVTVTGAIVVTTPQDVAILDTRKGIATFRKLDIPIIGAVLNMAHFTPPPPAPQEPSYIFGPPDAFRDTCKQLDLPVLAELPMDPDVSSQGDRGSPVVVLPGGSGGGVRQSFAELAARVWDKVA